MAASHTWGVLTFSTEARVSDSGAIRDSAEFDVPGVDGVEVVDKGWRGRMVEITGLHKEDSLQALREWINSANALVRVGTSTLSIYGVDPLQYCQLTAFRAPVVRRTGDGKYGARFAAAFRQLRPNDAEA